VSKRDFLEKVLVFVKDHGTIVSRESNPMYFSIQMKYNKDDLSIEASAYCHCMGNGSCSAKATYKDKLVYKANGSFIARPFDVKEKKHTAGKWEKDIKKVKLTK
jgi:hypothetical protein